MPADLATLGLRIENGQFIQGAKQAEGAVTSLGKTVDTSRVKFEAWQRELAQKAATAQAVENAKRLNAEIERTNTQAARTTVGIGRLRGSMTTLAASALSSAPGVAQFGSVVGMLELGSVATVGILAGLAAIGFAYNKLTEDSRKAKDEVKKMNDELDRAAASRFLATEAGQQSRMGKLADQFRAAQAQLAEAQAGRFIGAAGYGGQHVVVAADVAAAQANITLVMNRIREASLQFGEVMERNAPKIDRATKAVRDYTEAVGQLSRLQGPHISTTSGGFVRSILAGDMPNVPGGFVRPTDTGAAGARAAADEEQRQAMIAAKRYQDDMRAIWRQGLGKIITDGTRSFRDFFEDVLRLFSGLMSRMQQEGKTKGGAYKWLGIGSSAIAGGFTGYQIGTQQGSASGGALLGGIGGAAAGFQIAGPLGAVVGGLTGFAAGLIGGASAAREHAKALMDAQRVIAASIADFHDLALGQEGSLDATIRHIHEQGDQLRANIRANTPGEGSWWQSPESREHERQLIAQTYTDEALFIARVREQDAINKTTKALEELATSVRNAPSGFKIEPYVNRFGAPSHWVPGLGGPTTTPYSPNGGGLGPVGGSSVSISGATFNFILPQGVKAEQVGPVVMKYFRSIQGRTVGFNAPVAMAMDYAD